MNSAQVGGTLEDELELKSIGDDLTILNFKLKTDESYYDRSGSLIEKTAWVPIVAWNATARDIVNRGYGPGDYLEVEGRLSSVKEGTSSGAKGYSTQVVVTRIRRVSGGETPF